MNRSRKSIEKMILTLWKSSSTFDCTLPFMQIQAYQKISKNFIFQKKRWKTSKNTLKPKELICLKTRNFWSTLLYHTSIILWNTSPLLPYFKKNGLTIFGKMCLNLLQKNFKIKIGQFYPKSWLHTKMLSIKLPKMKSKPRMNL